MAHFLTPTVSHVSKPPPIQHNPSLSEVTQLYAIPFGVIGFTIHTWAYYNLAMVAVLYRSPLTLGRIRYPLASQAICYTSCISILILGFYHIIKIGKEGATWVTAITAWHSSLGMLFAAGQAHAIGRQSHTSRSSMIQSSVPFTEQISQKMRQWTVCWAYLIMCLVGHGLTIVITVKEWHKPKMVCVCGFSVGVIITILIVLPAWDRLAPLGFSGNGRLRAKEWVVVLCLAETLLSPLMADLVLGVTADSISGWPAGHGFEVIGVYILYLVASILPMFMI